MTKPIIFLLSLFITINTNAQVILDDWTTTAQAMNNLHPGTFYSTVNGSGILGGQRDMEVNGIATGVSGPYTSNFKTEGPMPGYLSYAGNMSHNLTKYVVTYDGNDDMDASTLNATTGFGATNMTGSGTFSATALGSDPMSPGEVWTLTFKVYSSPTNYSEVTYNFTSGVDVDAPLTISYPVSAFAAGAGASGPANFAAVTAIQFIFNRSGGGGGFDIDFEGGITVPSPTVTLPTNWLYFTGASKDGTAQLDWKVANETRTQNFTVERSTDGENYKAIGTVTSKNAGTETTNYQFIDASPIANLNYYRIKQTDLDGSFTYSIVQKVNMGIKRKTDFLVYPNPTNNFLTVERTREDSLPLEGNIFDLQGREVLKFATTDSKTTVNISNLPAGNYIVKLADGQSLLIQKQ